MKRNTLKRPQLQIPQLKDPKRISTLLAVSIFTFDPTFEVSRIIDLNMNLGSDRELLRFLEMNEFYTRST